MVLLLVGLLLYAAPVIVSNDASEIQLTVTDLDMYEDKTRSVNLDQVIDLDFQSNFNKDLNFTPQDYHMASAYWVKLKLVLPNNDKGYLLEFFDQTIDSLDIYVKHESDSAFTHIQLGDLFVFTEKMLAHKNFQVPLAR